MQSFKEGLKADREKKMKARKQKVAKSKKEKKHKKIKRVAKEPLILYSPSMYDFFSRKLKEKSLSEKVIMTLLVTRTVG